MIYLSKLETEKKRNFYRQLVLLWEKHTIEELCEILDANSMTISICASYMRRLGIKLSEKRRIYEPTMTDEFLKELSSAHQD